MKVALALRKSLAERFAVVLGVQSYARMHPDIELVNVNGEASLSWQQALESEPDAIIGFFHQQSHAQTVKEQGIAAVCVNSVYDTENVAVVRTDQKMVGHQAAQFLLDKDLLNFVFVSDQHDHFYSQARREGFVERLANFQLESAELLSDKVTDSLDWFKATFEAGKRVGVFCVNDQVARALLNQLEPLYPNLIDLCVFVGVDNDPFFYENGQIVFSSVDVDHRTVGETALQLLHRSNGKSCDGALIEVPPLGVVDRVVQEQGVHPVVDKALRYIASHYADKELTLEKIASKAGLSVRSLNRHLKANGKEPLSSCVQRARIEAAKKMMKEENLHLNEVAQSVGFQDYATFFRSFKRLEGVAPSDS